MGSKSNFICCLIIVLIFLVIPIKSHHLPYLGVISTNENQDILLKEAPSTTTISMSFTDVDWSYKSSDDDIWNEVTTPDLTGDHIVLRAESNEPLVVQSKLLFNPTATQQRDLVIPSDDFNPFTDLIPMNSPDVAWFHISEIPPDAIVTLVGRFSTINCDFMAWTTEINYTTWRYSNNLLGSSMSTSSYPEGASISWGVNYGTLFVACINRDLAEGWAEVDFYLDSDAEAWASGDTVSYDTYDLNQNVTTDIVYLGISAALILEKTAFYPNMSLNNYFSPNVTQFPPIDLGNNQFNFTWISEDRNHDDTNYYSVWLSSDGGFTYMMLAGNLSESYYLWDSTGYLERDDYLVKIRAYSLDFTNPELCGLDNPPGSYWPGDFSDSNLFVISAGDVGHGLPPGSYEINIYSPDNLTYIEHSIGNNLTWDISIDGSPLVYSIEFIVYHNGEQWLLDRFYPYTESEITVSVDGLSQGIHRFTLVMDDVVSDTVFVSVVASESSDNWAQILHYGAIGVSIGSSFIILYVIVLTIRLKKTYRSR